MGSIASIPCAPFWCRFVPVPAVDQDYAKGLTEFQHEVVCKFIRRTNQARINRKELAEAKEYIRRKIAEAFGHAPRKLKSANKIAKWMAFEDPTEAKFIYHSENDTNRLTNGEGGANPPDSGTEQTAGKVKFILPPEPSDKLLEWSDDESWGATYSDFDQEGL